jgi:hypothetical protein
MVQAFLHVGKDCSHTVTRPEKENTMAERIKSKDGTRDTDDILGAKGEVSQAGRSGGRLARDIGTQDEEKRAQERPAGATRVHKADEKEGGS